MSFALALILLAGIVLYIVSERERSHLRAARSDQNAGESAPEQSVRPATTTLPAATPAGTVPPASESGAATEAERSSWSAVEQRILELTNVERQKDGLPPLLREDGLQETARAQSLDMLRRQFFDHVNPSGQSPSDRIELSHRRLVGEAGENLWKGTGAPFASNPDLAAIIVRAWMESPHHRANILRKTFNRMGVGVVIEHEEVRATQNFSEEKAYLVHDLPRTVAKGDALDLSTTSESPRAIQFDLQRVDGVKRTEGPMPVEGARVTAQPGLYRLRLYFPDEKPGYSSIYDGPQIKVTALRDDKGHQ